MKINLAQETDLDAIQKVVETAFSDEENKIISKFAFDLLTETASPSIQSWVAEVDHQIIGYVSFSPIFLKSETDLSGYILSPLAVSPEHQKQGVGSSLINKGIDRLAKAGANVLLV